MSAEPADDEDDLTPVVLAAAPPAYARPRDPVELVARIKADGMRLDHYLQIYFQDHSRSGLQKAIDGGHVTVNGRPSKSSYKVRNDDKLFIQLPEPVHDVVVPEDIPLEILYEDDRLALVNKPPDMVVHPARGNWTGTLANALAFRFKDQLSSANGPFRPGIVHRLDRDTSGVILIAKDDAALRDLSMQFESRKVFKEYVALTAGVLERDTDYIEARIKHHPRIREQMIPVTNADDPEAKDAVSYYEVLERFRGYTLVKVQPKTGRTHQIRVHLAFVGCPVLADKVYGGRDRFTRSDLTGRPEDQAEVLIGRQALHAHRLRVRHPGTGTWIEAEAPLPADFRRALDAVREFRPLR